MGKLQGLLFALATVALVVVSTRVLHASLDAAAQVRPRRHRPCARGSRSCVTGVVFIVTNLILAWFGWRYQDAPGRQGRSTGTTTRGWSGPGRW